MESILDFSYIQHSIPLFVEALKVTIILTSGGICLSLAVGLVGSVILYFRVPVLYWGVTLYVQIARNIPVLVFLFFLYFGLVQVGIRFEGETCAILGLGIMGGAYMTESFRAGLSAVDKNQYESARSLGLGPLQILRFVSFPQAFAIVVPALLANAHAILMETAICGFVAVPELMYVTRDEIGMYYKTYEAFSILTVCYLVLLLPLSLAAGHWERRLRNAQYSS